VFVNFVTDTISFFARKNGKAIPVTGREGP
jgi:hypothetical protein